MIQLADIRMLQSLVEGRVKHEGVVHRMREHSAPHLREDMHASCLILGPQSLINKQTACDLKTDKD